MTSTPSFITFLQADPGEDRSLFTDTQARVEETLISLQQEDNVQIESSELDRREKTVIDKFLDDGCGCKMNCTNKLGREAIEERRGNCAELSKQELDMATLG